MTSEGKPGDAVEALKMRLRRDLRVALKARSSSEVSLLRALLAAIDNAQAVPVGDLHDRYVTRQFGDRCGEVPRLRLGAEELRILLQREKAEREETAAQLTELGQDQRATELRFEADWISRYLEISGETPSS